MPQTNLPMQMETMLTAEATIIHPTRLTIWELISPVFLPIVSIILPIEAKNISAAGISQVVSYCLKNYICNQKITLVLKRVGTVVPNTILVNRGKIFNKMV